MKIIITEQQLNYIVKKQSRLINENSLSNKTIINVDIQPEYSKAIGFNLHKWAKFINENAEENNIIFLYNGYDTLGMIEEYEYIRWLIDDVGIDEEVIENATFYDKGYAFFRYCMDSGIDEDAIVDLVRYMIKNDITDSREIDEDMWQDFMEQTNHNYEEIKDLLHESDDLLSIPDLMDFLGRFNSIVLTGGGINECLKEVEIALLALDKNYFVYSEFVY